MTKETYKAWREMRWRYEEQRRKMPCSRDPRQPWKRVHPLGSRWLMIAVASREFAARSR